MKSKPPVNKEGVEINFKEKSAIKKVKASWQLYVIITLPVIYLLVFAYYPMLGAQIAFKNFKITEGIWGSEWVGLMHFKKFVSSPQFWTLIKNTVALSIYSLIASFPIPIILAICLNYIRNKKFKKSLQMITYAPYFISTVVLVGIMLQMFSLRTGIVNNLIQAVGLEPISFFSKPEYFRHIYVWSGIWQGAGYSSIIYIAALAGIDQELYEAAAIDGASKWRQVIYIDIPSLLPTVVIMLIMSAGSILSVGFEKILLLQNPVNLKYSEVIATYVYKLGFESAIPLHSYGTAINLFTSVISLIMLSSVNYIAKKVNETSLW